jgi:hypothetical protein
MLEKGDLDSDSAGVVPWDWCTSSVRLLDNASRCSQRALWETHCSFFCDQEAPETHDASNKVYGCTKGKRFRFSREVKKGISLWGYGGRGDD